MDVIGIIGEYNPFHYGHAYHIRKIKTMYPNSLIILVLNGYFLERGEVSILNKKEKTTIALAYQVDLVVELPFVFGSNAADLFAEKALEILQHLKVQKLVFGSESNDINLLTKMAREQLNSAFQKKVKENLNAGLNYPTALNQGLDINIKKPNDLLGLSYIKAILKNNWLIEPISIQRTNDYHDELSTDPIISASNIRAKIQKGLNVSHHTPCNKFNQINEELLFDLIKYKIITDHNLAAYLSVDEGLEHKLSKEIKTATSLNDLIFRIKSKRYTYNRLRRMLMHLLIGLTKEDKQKLTLEYIKVLGFNNLGKNYLNQIKADLLIPIKRKIPPAYLAQQYELIVAAIYDLLTGDEALKFELANIPIKSDQ